MLTQAWIELDLAVYRWRIMRFIDKRYALLNAGGVFVVSVQLH